MQCIVRCAGFARRLYPLNRFNFIEIAIEIELPGFKPHLFSISMAIPISIWIDLSGCCILQISAL